MGFFLGIIIFFVFIWIVVKAFSSNEKEIHVTTIDSETGEKKVEVRKEIGSSAGKTAAQVTLWLLIGVPIIFIIFAATIF